MFWMCTLPSVLKLHLAEMRPVFRCCRSWSHPCAEVPEHPLPPPPLKRSSASISGVVVRTLRSR